MTSRNCQISPAVSTASRSKPGRCGSSASAGATTQPRIAIGIAAAAQTSKVLRALYCGIGPSARLAPDIAPGDAPTTSVANLIVSAFLAMMQNPFRKQQVRIDIHAANGVT